MQISFTKMHGLGNSYIFLNLFDFDVKETDLIPLTVAVSDSNTGIGADGLILIHPSETADVGMRIFNKDGSEGKNCGNGLRCVAKFAVENGLISNNKFSIETRAGLVTAETHGSAAHVEEVTVDMGKPHLSRGAVPMTGKETDQVVSESFSMEDYKMEITAVSMGNPHAVFFVEDIEKAPLRELGPLIATDQRFPEGINVEFVEILSKSEMNFRVWERGSGITQACGTGACAAVVASVLNGFSNREQEVTVHLAGGDLFIKWAEDGRVWMRGKAETTVTGVFHWNKKFE